MKLFRIITPLLILMLISIIWAILIIIDESDGQGWGLLVAYALIGFAIGFLIIDLLLKRFLNNWKKVLIAETGIVLLILFLFKYQNRQLILELPRDFSEQYVSIIYNVENEKELGITPFTWQKEIKVPSDGIVMTSSEINEHLPKTDFKSFDGEYYNSTENQKMFVRMTDSEFRYDGQTYKIRTWRLGEGEFLVSTSKEHQAYKKELINSFKNKAGL